MTVERKGGEQAGDAGDELVGVERKEEEMICGEKVSVKSKRKLGTKK